MKNTQEESESRRSTLYKNDRLFIQQGVSREKYFYVDILYIEASGSYCKIYFKEGSKMLVTHPLARLERELPEHLFMRVHRQFLLNLEYIDAFVGNSVRVGKALLPVSRPHRKELFGLFHFLEDLSRQPDEMENEE